MVEDRGRIALAIDIGGTSRTWRRSLHIHIAIRPPTLHSGDRIIVALEEVMSGQVFKGRRTSLRAGSASQVFARSRTASEDKDAGHGPEGIASVGHAFKTGVGAKAPRRVRFPSASATSDLRKRASKGSSGRTPIGSEAEFAQVDSNPGGVACTAPRQHASYLVVTRIWLAALRRMGYARLSSSTGMVRTPAVWRSYSAKPGYRRACSA